MIMKKGKKIDHLSKSFPDNEDQDLSAYEYEKGERIDHWSLTIMMPPSPPPWGSHGMIRQAK